MTVYYRPLAQFGPESPRSARPIAGGWCWFDMAERIERDRPGEIVPVTEIPDGDLDVISSARSSISGLEMDTARLMGILNVTPDSFSDGGKFLGSDKAVAHAIAMIDQGADILDIGGESTRPGAAEVPEAEEITRIVPVIAAIRKTSAIPISIDTRKAAVARAALDAGGSMINDVSAFNFDPELAELTAQLDVPVCLMHAQGDPETMQQEPTYENVLLDIYDALSERIAFAQAAGISRENIVIDPGIGFGKTLDHNLALLQGLSLFHGLGCPILLGASRKRFIGMLGRAPDPKHRAPGSIAVTLAAVAQGVQIHRVHDISETRQALTLWSAATGKRQ